MIYTCIIHDREVSDPPSDLQTTVVSSRNITIKWNRPVNTYSEENYGYVIQLKNDSECVKEAVYRCSNCLGTFQPLELKGMCSSVVRDTFSKTKSELDDLQTYQFLNLQPDTAYTINVAAVTNLGRGNAATIVQTTYEEAPQSPPYNVEVSDIRTTSFRVSWRMDEPRPGQTNFTITVFADKPAATKEFSTKGFATRSYIVQGLEEYWGYSVTVTAVTSVGAKTSDATLQYRTLPAAPGKVSNFEITDAPGGNYTNMQISWNAPAILQRNGVIKDYSLIFSSSKNIPEKKILAHTFVEFHIYTATVDVIPGEIYSVEVYATNEQDLKGASTTKFVQAPTAEKSRTGSDCDGAKNSIIIGVVLGALLLIVSTYAGYATLVIRRYKTKQEVPESSKTRTKQRRGPIYGNETFMIGETEEIDSSDPAAVRHSETEYTRLDENTKDDKGTYDIIQAM
ncbi:receptor-type tyrosine-protein phosphatase F-like [Mercenaria mercenaria]|uniref:receptor-type tyrosine-protein phosphatase F-like n=1 Tax=Mercenaria mercenaria TaxID=6596 RepID=UPI00234FA9D5|nr:receptor-type tyrosine-protein phosphatase F-like [Mercenaria mercenaria]